MVRKFKRMGCFWRMALVAGAMLFVVIAGYFMLGRQANDVRIPEDQIRQVPPATLARPSSNTQAVGVADLKSIKTYDDYLRWRASREPALADTAQIYAEVHLRFENDKVAEAFKSAFLQVEVKGAESNLISNAQIAWLKSNVDFIESLHRLSACHPLPGLSLEERQARQALDSGLDPIWLDSRFLIYGVKLLLTEAQWRRQEHDSIGAARAFCDAYQFMMLFSDDDYELLWRDIALGLINRAVLPWVLEPRTPPAELSRLADLLDRLDAPMFPADFVNHFFLAVYLSSRAQMIEKLNASNWRDPVYGMGDIFQSEEYRWGIRKIDRLQIPRPDLLVFHTVRAIYRRQEMPRVFKALDEETLGWIKATRDTPVFFARLKQNASKINPKDQSNFLQSMMIDSDVISKRFIYFLHNEANFRLIRLAAHWRVDPQGTLARRSEASAGQPNQLWRDPFTGKPFMVDEDTTTTRIYSLGPDLEDQRGRIAFDTQRSGNGNFINDPKVLTGDIAIELPR